jgi:TolB-like protein
MTFARGSRLGDFEVLGLLGAGGMGEVYEAQDTRLDRRVALKVLPADFAADPDRLARFQREAKTVAALNHPNIVTLFGVEETDGMQVLVMERISGRSLAEILEPGGLPLKQVLNVASQAAEALGAAHDKGVVHRDLKPGNIMVTDEGRVKILDFGLARMRVPSGYSADTQIQTETQTKAGQVFGTVPYMAPEQLRGERVDARADIFSFGAVLYEMASGRPPFAGKSAADLVSAILREEPAPLEELRPDLPPAFARIVRRCLEKEPLHRAQSALDLHQELRDLSENLRTLARGTAPAVQLPATAPIPTPARGLRGRWPSAVAAVLLAGIAVLIIPRLPALRLSGARTIRSIAVLPFANLTHDASEDYFVEGLHDALITNLAKLGAFGVTSRASVARYKTSSKSAKDVARELGVDAVIEGSVLRAGNRVRVSAQLIRGATDEHLWAESYNRDVQDVLGLLNDVSYAIANEVHTTIARGGRTPLPPEPRARPVRPEAYDAHLRAHHLLMATRLAPDDLRKVLELQQQSVGLDPEFAEGWSGVAWANFALAFFDAAPASEVIPRAREAAWKALALDDRQGGAQGVLGMIGLYFDWTFESARSRLERAVALDPHSFMTRHAWADYLMITGHPDESLAQVKLGRSNEPASPMANAVVLYHWMTTRRYDEVVAEAQRTIALFPGSSRMMHGVLADALWRQNRYAEAIAEYREQLGANSEVPRLLESGLARAGPGAALKARADRLAADAQAGRANAFDVAAVYAESGERESAFQWLEKAYEERAPQLLHVVAMPDFDGIRADPRYADLIRRIGIPPAR